MKTVIAPISKNNNSEKSDDLLWLYCWTWYCF